ncbi:MAG: winged helix-turn-helix domain-containing protein, partial [Muribaculaceae bacterium]|nr:winged helix-turn-helix domain-containing protein [Muribaculaceae bacterium]
NEVWDKNVVVTNRTVDTNLTRLRKKRGSYGKHIETRVGFGYGFNETA